MKYDNIKYNSYYLGLVQNLYAGTEGEVIAVLQELYQSYQTSLYEQEISDFLYEFALQDLKHQKMLSDIIIQLGGDPIYANSQNKFIGGRNIDYIKNPVSMLKIDKELKEKNIIDYKITISKIDDESIKEVLEMILENKIKQKDLLEYYLNKILKN